MNAPASQPHDSTEHRRIRALGGARARELKAQQPITPEQAAVVARLVLTGAPKSAARGTSVPRGMRQPGDEGSS